MIDFVPTGYVPTSPAEVKQLALLRQWIEAKRREKLKDYRPYPKQLEFHAAVGKYREVLLRAGSQGGKTYSAAAETAYHLTGDYPDWWPGRRMPMATKAWVVSESREFIRDNAQRLLMGDVGEWGTGMIPADRIIRAVRSQHSVADALDSVEVRHVSGGKSILYFKSAEAGREKLQGATLNFVWVDEEIPIEIYLEVLARTTVSGGPVFTTFTPLKGETALVRRFLVDKAHGTHNITMTLYESQHFSKERLAEEIAKYPEHQRRARVLGEPALGSGQVFAVDESLVSVAPFKIPDHWPRLCGMDFGWTHPAAIAWMAFDRDTDTGYVYDCFKASQQKPAEHVAAWRAKGDWIYVAWGAEVLQTEKSTGIQLAVQYRRQGMKMLREKAMLQKAPESGAGSGMSRVSVEAGVMDMLQAMSEGRFKVFSNVDAYWQEHRSYHRDERGVIVKANNDLIDAVRYCWVSRRHAKTKAEGSREVYLPEFSYSDRT